MRTETITVPTGHRVDMVDVTRRVETVLKDRGWQDGILTLFIPHTTAGITINENADPDVKRDMIMEMNKVIPFDDGYAHYEGNSAAHIKTSLFGSSETIIVEKGKLVLGTWQGIYLAEFDGPRTRKLYLKFMGELK